MDFLGQWAGMKSPPKIGEWLPTYARMKRGVPQWVRDDMRVGVDLRLASQELYDALSDLEGNDG